MESLGNEANSISSSKFAGKDICAIRNLTRLERWCRKNSPGGAAYCLLSSLFQDAFLRLATEVCKLKLFEKPMIAGLRVSCSRKSVLILRFYCILRIWHSTRGLVNSKGRKDWPFSPQYLMKALRNTYSRNLFL